MNHSIFERVGKRSEKKKEKRFVHKEPKKRKESMEQSRKKFFHSLKMEKMAMRTVLVITDVNLAKKCSS